MPSAVRLKRISQIYGNAGEITVPGTFFFPKNFRNSTASAGRLGDFLRPPDGGLKGVIMSVFSKSRDEPEMVGV